MSGAVMRRRGFIECLGATASLTGMAQAQPSERMRRIAVFIAGDEEVEARVAAIENRLRQLGWIDGKNLRFSVHKTTTDSAGMRKRAEELVATAPDVIITAGSSHIGALLQATRTIPIVFSSSADPVGAGYVQSLRRPGGNITGFMLFDYSLSGKWPELLKQISPSVTSVAVIRDADSLSGIGQFAVIQFVASAIGIDVTPVNLRSANEIESAVDAIARAQNCGLIATTSPRVLQHADLIVRLAAKYRLTAIYPRRSYAERGGLCSYGPDVVELSGLAAGYADRILKGEKPADLPVQAPTRYELIVNLKTASQQGLTIPPTILARADQVIE